MIVAQSQPGTSNGSPRCAEKTPRIRYLSMISHSATASGSAIVRAVVTLSRASMPPRIAQQNRYRAAVTEMFTARAAW
jgi:hypothetical protein